MTEPGGPGFHDIGDIDLDWAEPGQKIARRTLAKRVVYCRKGWALIVFLFQDRSRDQWTQARYMIAKWRRVAFVWRRESSITFQPGEHARGVLQALLELEEQRCQIDSTQSR